MKWECEMIQDMLPLYIEEMVSDKTKAAVEEHLEECPECKSLYLDMQKEEIEVIQKQTNHFKRFQWNMLIEIVAVAIVEILMMSIFFRYYTMTNGWVAFANAVLIFSPMITFLTGYRYRRNGMKKTLFILVASMVFDGCINFILLGGVSQSFDVLYILKVGGGLCGICTITPAVLGFIVQTIHFRKVYNAQQ